MELSENNKVEIYSQNDKKNFFYDRVKILSLKISYPKIRMIHNLYVQNHINSYYSNKAQQFYRYASTSLKQLAIDSYHYANENNYPFIEYEAVMNYTVTKNEDYLLSTFFDQYVFTGGAHGNTIRSSINWDLQNGKVLSLSDLCDPKIILGEIIESAHLQAKENPFLYFENYEELLIKYFNEDNFYLTQTGISVFYQQYEIGPYASGIIVFDVSC